MPRGEITSGLPIKGPISGKTAHPDLTTPTTTSSSKHPARCDICRENFPSKASLNSHRWRHFCTVCHQLFTNTNDTTAHQRHEHRANGSFAERCSVCFELFPSSDALWRHFIDSHHRTNRSIEESELPPSLAEIISDRRISATAKSERFGGEADKDEGGDRGEEEAIPPEPNSGDLMTSSDQTNALNHLQALTALNLSAMSLQNLTVQMAAAATTGSSQVQLPQGMQFPPLYPLNSALGSGGTFLPLQLQNFLLLKEFAKAYAKQQRSEATGAHEAFNPLLFGSGYDENGEHKVQIRPTSGLTNDQLLLEVKFSGAEISHDQAKRLSGETFGRPLFIKEEPADKDEVPLDGCPARQRSRPERDLNDKSLEDALVNSSESALATDVTPASDIRDKQAEAACPISKRCWLASGQASKSQDALKASQHLNSIINKLKTRIPEPEKSSATNEDQNQNGVETKKELVDIDHFPPQKKHPSKRKRHHCVIDDDDEPSDVTSRPLKTERHDVIAQASEAVENGENCQDEKLATSHTSSSSDDGLLESFSSENLWEELKHRKYVVTCDCGLAFTDRVLHMLHFGSHSHDGSRTCTDCGLKAPSWLDFFAHFLGHHGKL